MFRAVIDNSVHLAVACDNEEKEEAYSSEVSRGEALEDRFSGKGLAQMVNTAKCVRTHRHCNALKK